MWAPVADGGEDANKNQLLFEFWFFKVVAVLAALTPQQPFPTSKFDRQEIKKVPPPFPVPPG
jgi:hypothetical protein